MLDSARLRAELASFYRVDARNVHAYVLGDSEFVAWSTASIANMGLPQYCAITGVEAIVRDESSVLTVSTLLQGEYGLRDVCLSLPAVVGFAGVRRVLPVPLAPDEVQALHRSAEAIRQVGSAT